MYRTKSIAVFLALGAVLAATPATTKPRGEAPNRGLNSLRQPVVQRTDYVMDLSVAGDGLSAGEMGRLNAWFETLGLGYGDRIWVDEPYPSGSRDDVARLAAEYGLMVGEGSPITANAVQSGSLRVVVSRSSASVPGCPHWSGRGGITSTSPNYGCATNSNLAAMVADPSDLVLGQAGSGTRDNGSAAKAIRVYRETPPTGAKGLSQINTTGGN